MNLDKDRLLEDCGGIIDGLIWRIHGEKAELWCEPELKGTARRRFTVGFSFDLLISNLC